MMQLADLHSSRDCCAKGVYNFMLGALIGFESSKAIELCIRFNGVNFPTINLILRGNVRLANFLQTYYY